MRFEVDWKKAGLAAGKLVLVLSGASMVTGAVDIVASLSRKAPSKLTPKQKAADWIGRALAAAILDVFEDARARHEAEQAKPPEARDDACLLKAPLPDRLDEIVFDADDLPRGFLERPDRLDVWAEVGDAVLHALKDAGYGEGVLGEPDRPEHMGDWLRLEIAGDLPDRFVEMLAVLWRELGLDEDGTVGSFFRTPVDAAAAAATTWRAHRRGLVGWPHDPANNRLFGEAFPIADLYVPLRGYEVLDPDGSGYDHDVPDPAGAQGQRKPAWHFDLTERSVEWFRTAKKHNSMALVSGGPGSGKSTFARMFAARIAVRPNWRVLYVPLHEVKDARTWDQALATLAEIADLPHGLAADLADGPRRTFAVLEGIDEMQTLGHGVSVSMALFDNLATRLATDRLRVLALGRDIGVDAIRPKLGAIAPTRLHVVPLVCDEDLRNRFEWESEVPGFDLRPDWWARYRRALPGSAAPDVMSADVLKRLPDLTASPVLNALLGLMVDGWDAAEDGPLDLAEMDRARLYDRVIRGVHKRAWGLPEGALLNTLRDPARFLRFLEAVALAAFRDSTRTASFAPVQAALDDPEVAAELERLLRHQGGLAEPRGDLPDLAMMAFHFRLASVAGEARFEFTHKSFADYLLARRIVRAAEDKLDPGAWVETFGDVYVTGEVFKLVREEARRRSDSVTEPLAEPADRLVAHLAGLLAVSTGTGFPLPAGTGGWTEARLRTRGAHAECALLAAIDAFCRAQDTPGEAKSKVGRAPVAWPDAWAARRLIQRQYERVAETEGLMTGSLVIEHVLARLGFAPLDGGGRSTGSVDTGNERPVRLPRVYLQDADLRGADLRGADLRGTDLQRAKLQGAALRGAHLRGAQLRGADLQRADLLGAHVHIADLQFADLQFADLQGADLQGADLREARGLSAEGIADARDLDQAIMTPGQRSALGLAPQPQDRELWQEPDESANTDPDRTPPPCPSRPAG